MGKSKDATNGKATSSKSSKSSKSSFPLAVSSKAIDPTLASLFGSSSGPVKAPQRVYKPFTKKEEKEDDDSATVDGESDSEGGSEETTPKKASTTLQTTAQESSRKSKRKRDEDNLEDEYMSKLQQEEVKETARIEKEKVEQAKASKKADSKKANAAEDSEEDDDDEEEEEEEDSEDGESSDEDEVAAGEAGDAASGDDSEGDDSEDDSEDSESDEKAKKDSKKEKKVPSKDGSAVPPPIRHETQDAKAIEDLDKSARTIFLGNLPSSVISSKPNYKILKSVFSAPGKISSIRFRSIAFSEQIPRKAAFVTHKLHEKQQTVNAYIVYKTKDSAREALKLNGAVVLDRHVRVDSVAHPAKQDATRCVFIGNLDFESQEESLWRHFASCGKIESVRIVRDAVTNVGKGFAYVQFEDGTSVEKAILMDGQKMQGDRKLRVSRAKNVKRKHKATVEVRAPPPKKQKTYVPKEDPKQKEMLGRARNLLGKAGAAKMKKAPEAFVFEGVRATAKTNPGVKLGGKKGGKKGGGAGGKARATSRSAAWKKKA